MDFLIGLLLIVFLFALSIFVHELGHFAIAKWCGLQIDTFSIGFGPALIKKNINGVEYKVGVLPLGGYVALPQMDPTVGKLSEERGRNLSEIDPLKKIAVSVAGAIMNILLAFVLCVAVFYMGKPVRPSEIYSTVGYVNESSEAYRKGIRMGDEIVRVGERKVNNWNEIFMESSLHKDQVLLTVKRGDALKEIQLPLTNTSWKISLIPGIGSISYCRIVGVDKKLNAFEAGIKPGDLIVEADGQKIFSQEQLSKIIQDKEFDPLKFKIKRDDQMLSFTIYPKKRRLTRSIQEPRKGFFGFLKDLSDPILKTKVDERYLIGISWDLQGYDFNAPIHPHPMGEMKYFAGMIFRILHALTTPSQSGQAFNALSGPVGIFAMFWIFKESLSLAFWFTALLNVNLAILNLLPIPFLDGGHIMFSLWEWITGKKIKTKIITGLSQVFVTLLIGLFLVLTYRDIFRFILDPLRYKSHKIEEVIIDREGREVRY